MKSQDKKALQTKTIEEIAKMINDAKQALAAVRFEHVQGQLKDTSSITNKRKEIAILQTVLQGKASLEAKTVSDKGGQKNG